MPTDRLEQFFHIQERGSSVQTEVIAGVSTFLALSYIFVVNPAILSRAGMDPTAVLFATVVASGLGTVLMGIWANLPFVLAPGMEMNAYVAFVVVGGFRFSWQQALGAVFWSGIVFLLLTISRVREQVIEAIPARMKPAIAFSVGVFLALIAFRIAGIIRYDGSRFIGFGPVLSADVTAFLISLALVLVLRRMRVKAAVLASILLTSFVYHAAGWGSGLPATVSATGSPFSALFKADLLVLADPRSWSVVLVLFLIDFFGSVAKLIGLTTATNLPAGGKLPGMHEALLTDGAATVGGSALGTSSLTVYVESGVGIQAGGRTGLSALVSGALMLLVLLLAPYLHLIPLVATTGALVFVALELAPNRATFVSMGHADRIALLLMSMTVLFFSALDWALAVGFLVYTARSMLEREPVNRWAILSLGLLLLGICLQLL